MVAVFLALMAYVAYKSYDKLERLVITPEEEAAKFAKQLESSELVNKSLEQLKMDLGAEFVVIHQFHNGRHDLTGIPFTEATATFYTDEPIIIKEPLAAMGGTLRRMWRKIDAPQCIEIAAPVDVSSRKYFKEADHVVKCPLINLLNYPIGTITVGFSTSAPRYAIPKTLDVAERVTGYLNAAF